MRNPKERVHMSSKELIVNIVLIVSTITLGVQVYEVQQGKAPIPSQFVY
jgi:hypothetical protein